MRIWSASFALDVHENFVDGGLTCIIRLEVNADWQETPSIENDWVRRRRQPMPESKTGDLTEPEPKYQYFWKIFAFCLLYFCENYDSVLTST